MPRALKFVKPRLLVFDALQVSDHNRQELSVDVERIETTKRMANGTMRKYVVADKRTFSTSWNELPGLSTFTVDGHAGADALETFYDTHQGAFALQVHLDTGVMETYTVMFTDFSKTVNKRGKLFNFYNVNISMEEV